MVMKNIQSNEVWFTLRIYTWAACCWRLIVKDNMDDRLLLHIDDKGGLEWMFCVDPHVWMVLEVEHYRTRECIVFHQTGPSESLLSFSLTRNIQMLECEDLIRMWSCFASPPDEVDFYGKA